MVVYLARCKSNEDAGLLQQKLLTVCPTLIYSRVLQKPQDLDVYNKDLLLSGDDGLRLGEFTFNTRVNPYEDQLKSMSKWMVVSAVLLLVGLFLGLGTLQMQTVQVPTIIAISVSLLASVGILVYISMKAAKEIPPMQRALFSADKWLKKGMPVLLAASDHPPDEREKLPKQLQYFDHTAHPLPPYRKSA